MIKIAKRTTLADLEQRRKQFRDAPDLQDEFDDENLVQVSPEGTESLEIQKDTGPKANPFVLKELGQVPPPDYPFRWLEQEKRPESPQVEYICSPYLLTLQVLARRWEGLHTYSEIEQSFQENRWKTQRFSYQDKVARMAQEASLAADAGFRARIINESVMTLYALKERLEADIDSDFEYEKATNAGPLGYVKRPLGIRNKTSLVKALIEVDNALLARVGVATQIHEQNVNVKVGPQRSLQDHLKESDPEYAELLKIMEMGKVHLASSPPAIEEGGSIHDLRPEFQTTQMGQTVGNRLFEVTQAKAASIPDE